MKIPFNKPYFTGKESIYIEEAVNSGKISGDGIFTRKCHEFFESRFGFNKVLLTTSCTDALELAALLIDIEPGDEIIMPSYTFVSTANAFVLRGAKIVFIDSHSTNPNMDVELLGQYVTHKTKAIVVVHYAGIATDMDSVVEVAKRNNLYIIEDAAQSIDSCYKGKTLGAIGDLAAFSFHETKNIISGEGGMLVINNEKFASRAEIIREKGTNRSAFFRGEVDKYGWVDIGSSFLPSDIIAAFLYAQLENLDVIQRQRKHIWNRYKNGLQGLADSGYIKLPVIPEFATNNAHMFYIICGTPAEREALINYLKGKDILAVFHYLSLHKSRYYCDKHGNRELPMSDFYSEHLLRLPFYFELTNQDLTYIINHINEFYKQ